MEKAWNPRKLKDAYEEFANKSTAKNPKAIICISNLYLKDPDQDQHSLVKDHVGFHPDVMRGIATNKAFIAAAKARELAIKDCIDKGFDEVVVITYCNQNRHRSVGSGFLLREILLEAGHAVVVNTVDAEAQDERDVSWPVRGEGGTGSRGFGITANLPKPDDFFLQDGEGSWLARVESDCVADRVLTRLYDEFIYRARHAAMLVGAMATSAGHEAGARGHEPKPSTQCSSIDDALGVQGPPHADPQWTAEVGGILVLSCQHSRCMGL